MSALESAFLALESRDVPFVFACVLELDRPIDVAPLRSLMETALAELPRYHQRIVRRRIRGARWRDDPAFEIARHVQTIDVPAPGGARELEALVARLLATRLPRQHPPWRLYTTWGLANGRGAVIAIVHHALVDGVAGIELLRHLLGAPRQAPSVVVHAPRKTSVSHAFVALVKLLREGLQPASQIGLNPRHTGPAREVASLSIDLERVKAIEHVFGVTNNDVVLATVSGALRTYLARRGLDPDKLDDVRAMVPVGRHAERALAGNRVALMLTALRIDEPDPVARLHRIANATRTLKGGHTAAGGDLLVAISSATTPALLAGVLRLTLRVRAFNAIVTNIPGPAESLSLLGARLERLVPIVNLWPHQALGIAVASSAGALTFGLQVDRRVIGDVAQLRDDLAAAFDELSAASVHLPPRATSERNLRRRA